MVSWVVPGFSEDRELGSGASGRVVAAVRVADGQRVAIKYLSARLLRDPRFVAAFRGEAALLGSLEVPHVVRLLEYAEAPGQGAAIVMELVEGVSLHEMITQQGPASPESALAVLKGSLLGLAAAHALGIVHRDYKPENVLVDGSGQSKLTDFGVAARAGQEAAGGGTPLYMAPEQWNGGPATPATDIYAATAVFFECLTGMTPFSGGLGQLAAQHAAAAVPVGLVDEPLRGLITRGMAKDPAGRPADASQFTAELAATAAAAYGMDWEERGRARLAERAAALLLLSHGGAATGAGLGTAAASTSLPVARTARAGRAASHGWLYAGITAAVVGVAAVSGAIEHWPPAIYGKSAATSGNAASVARDLSKLTWTAAEPAMPVDLPGGGEYNGVACPASGTCVLAGPYTNAQNSNSSYGVLTDTVTAGKLAPATFAPVNLGGSADQPVHGLACAAPGNCMTAGEWLDPSSGLYTGLIDALSNGTWTPASLSLPANAGQDQEVELDGIACPAVGNCVTVGSNYNGGSGNYGWGLIQTLHDGAWTAAEAPLPTGAAKGDKGNGVLHAVACSEPGSCVAVGFYTQADGSSQGLIETLRKGTWAPATAPLPPGEAAPMLNAISCSPAGLCVAVGYDNATQGSNQVLIETLSGGTWHPAKVPLPKGAPRGDTQQLTGVSCPAGGSCVAVGHYESGGENGPGQGVIDTLNNGTWTTATAPLPANAAQAKQSAGLSAVACDSAGFCVASGGYTDDASQSQVLIESTAPVATAASTPTPGATPANGSTRTFPDGTQVTLVSAEWTVLSQYDQAPYGVKFTFHIVAGPQWTSSSRVHLCVNCGDQRPDEDYMVTVGGWAYPATNSTGYADLVTGITPAQGVPQPINTAVAAGLSAGDSVSVSSTLIPPSGSPGDQQVTVTIELPDTTLASQTFTVNISPNPSGSQP
jgi:hypothetical protein